MLCYRGSLARHTGNAPEASLRPCVLWQGWHGYVRAPLDAAHLHANATQRRAVEGNLGGFCLWPWLRSTETAPARPACRGRSCRNSGWVDHEEGSPTGLVEAALDRIEKHRIRPTISETQAMPDPKSIMLQSSSGSRTTGGSSARSSSSSSSSPSSGSRGGIVSP